MNIIEERRKAMGLTQGELAKLIHKTQSCIQRYEANAIPRGDVLIALAIVLNCSPSEIIDSMENAKNVKVVQIPVSELEDMKTKLKKQEEELNVFRSALNYQQA